MEDTSQDTEQSTNEHTSLSRNPDYRNWFVADACTSATMSIRDFVLPLMAQNLTGSPALATLLSSITQLTSGVLRLPGGVLQDKVDRRKLLTTFALIGLGVYGLAAVLVSNASIAYMALIVLALLLGARSGLLGDTSNAMLRGLVPDNDLPRAMSLNYSRDSVIDLACSPVGGFLLSLGNWAPMTANALLSLAQAVAALRIKHYWKPEHINETANEPADGTAVTSHVILGTQLRTFATDATAGLRWIFTDSFQRRRLCASVLMFPCMQAVFDLTILDVNTAGTKESLLAATLLSLATSVGVLIGSFLVTALIDHVRGGVLCVGGIGCIVGCMVLCTLTPSVLLKALLFALSLVMLPCVNAVFGAFGALIVSPAMQGRFSAANSMVSMLVSPVVIFAGGLAMQFIGYRPTTITLAILAVIFALPLITYRPMFTLPKSDQWNAHIDKCGLGRI